MALSSVIIFKLPFPVPEPIIDYKCSLSGDKHLMEVLGTGDGDKTKAGDWPADPESDG